MSEVGRMRTLKKIVHRMLGMCPAAWRLFLLSIQASCALLLVSLMLLLGVLPSSDGGRLAAALYELPQALLLIGLLSSVCVEDVVRRNS